tara:strand:- start:2429 stop:2605 length:177 start_codon:yes stop_codon:yes gene_type:complete
MNNDNIKRRYILDVDTFNTIKELFQDIVLDEQASDETMSDADLGYDLMCSLRTEEEVM